MRWPAGVLPTMAWIFTSRPSRIHGRGWEGGSLLGGDDGVKGGALAGELHEALRDLGRDLGGDGDAGGHDAFLGAPGAGLPHLADGVEPEAGKLWGLCCWWLRW